MNICSKEFVNKNNIKISCINKVIELKFSDSIIFDREELIFWLERFVPGVRISTSNSIDYTILINKSNTNHIKYDNSKTIISGVFKYDLESSIAKYTSQLFAKLLIDDGYFLIPGACVAKNNTSLIIVGDFWQGKTSVALSLFDNFNYDIISDNYIIIKNDKVICGTKHISIRKENTKLVNKINKKYLLYKNNRLFYDSENSKNQYNIGSIVTCYINNGDNNIHVVSKEESQWFLYGKFSRLYNGEGILFNGSIPSPIFNNQTISQSILNEVNNLLDKISLYYLSSSMDNISKYINNKILVNSIEYNFAIKLTTNCPGNCTCCKNRQDNFKIKDTEKKAFNLETFNKICKCIKKIGGSYICLSGGEPTIISNLTDYIKLASNQGLNVRLNTNGWGITEEKFNEWIKAGLGQVVLSIYSLDRTITGLARGNPYIYDRVIKAADIIKKVKETNDFVFIVQSVIEKDNYLEIAEIFNFAMEHDADMYWPSYLEDAINLENIRLTEKNIKKFKSEVIPKMEMYINNYDKYKGIKNKIILDIRKIYNKEYKNYIYHDSNITCPWLGKHFTFYPNGIVDPCLGHEYFKSKYQWHIDYENIEDFFTKDNLEKSMLVQYEYCKYCPQGEHKSICLSELLKHEHSRKENKNE